MSRKPKIPSERHSEALSIKVTIKTRRELQQLAERAGLRISAYSARVLEKHVAAPSSVTPLGGDLEVARLRHTLIGTPAYAYPWPVIEEMQQARGDFAFECLKDLLKQIEQYLVPRGALEDALDLFRKRTSWHESSGGAPPSGETYEAFEAAWLAGAHETARSLAREAKKLDSGS